MAKKSQIAAFPTTFSFVALCINLPPIYSASKGHTLGKAFNFLFTYVTLRLLYRN